MASTAANMFAKYMEGFAVLGTLTATVIILKVVCTVCSGIRAFILSSGVDFKKLGQWAVVTGATDGIGKAYASELLSRLILCPDIACNVQPFGEVQTFIGSILHVELAKRGNDIVLVSRSPEKLGEAAAEIESKHGVKTKTIAVDFTAGAEIYEKIQKELSGLDIGVLVNNVGMSYPFPQFFGELPTDKQVLDLLNVNMTSCTMMTRIVLPGMVEKKKGAIINISSGSGNTPTPLLTQYSATKAYTDFFSRALQQEYRSKGIIIQSVLPFFVATKLSKLRNTSFMIPNPTSYARSALNTVGVQDRTYGCMAHAVQGYVMDLLPVSLNMSLSMKMLMPARVKGFKKQGKQQ